MVFARKRIPYFENRGFVNALDNAMALTEKLAMHPLLSGQGWVSPRPI